MLSENLVCVALILLKIIIINTIFCEFSKSVKKLIYFEIGKTNIKQPTQTRGDAKIISEAERRNEGEKLCPTTSGLYEVLRLKGAKFG